MCPDNVPAQSPGTGHCGLGPRHAYPPHIYITYIGRV